MPDSSFRGLVMRADANGIGAAVRALSEGRLVIHPTETVASLSGDPYRHETVDAARRLKGYEEERPFLCLVADVEAARALAATWPETARILAETFWPGPLTLVVHAGSKAPRPVQAAERLALRPASDPTSSALLAAWAGPLFSTSANRRGEQPLDDAVLAAASLVGAPGFETIALALVPEEDRIGGGLARPSTVVDVVARPPRILRSGAVSVDRLREACPELEE